MTGGAGEPWSGEQRRAASRARDDELDIRLAELRAQAEALGTGDPAGHATVAEAEARVEHARAAAGDALVRLAGSLERAAGAHARAAQAHRAAQARGAGDLEQHQREAELHQAAAAADLERAGAARKLATSDSGAEHAGTADGHPC